MRTSTHLPSSVLVFSRSFAATRVDRRRAILDVLLETVEPGQQITIKEMAARVQTHPDMRHLISRTPEATISTALARAGDHFMRVRPGVYRRACQPEPSARGTNDS